MKTLFFRPRRRLPVDFLPESTQFFKRIAANGGTIGNAAMAAVDQFVRELYQRELWHKLLDVGVFAGDQLTAALVKLKCASGAPETFVNVNFVAGDYVETGATAGLLGNGSTKCLRTGCSPAALEATGHLSVYTRDNLPGTGMHGMMGASSGADEFSLVQSASALTGRFGQTAATTVADLNKGFLCVARMGPTDLRLYRDGTQVDLNSTSVTPGSVTDDIALFGITSMGSPSLLTNLRAAFYSVGRALTPAEVSSLYTAVQMFQTALNRAV